MSETDIAALPPLCAPLNEAEAAADATAHPLTTPQDAAERMEKEMAARSPRRTRRPASLRYEQNTRTARAKNAVALALNRRLPTLAARDFLSATSSTRRSMTGRCWERCRWAGGRLERMQTASKYRAQAEVGKVK